MGEWPHSLFGKSCEAAGSRASGIQEMTESTTQQDPNLKQVLENTSASRFLPPETQRRQEVAQAAGGRRGPTHCPEQQH